MSIYIFIYIHCLFMKEVWLFSSLSKDMGGLLNFGSRPLVSLLNSIVDKLSSLGLIAVNHVCKKAI